MSVRVVYVKRVGGVKDKDRPEKSDSNSFQDILSCRLAEVRKFNRAGESIWPNPGAILLFDAPENQLLSDCGGS
jgi:hypothetical protein